MDLSSDEATPGAVEVDIGIDIEGPSESDIRNAFYSTVITNMDVDSLKEYILPRPFDHVIHARYVCYGSSCGFAAC